MVVRRIPLDMRLPRRERIVIDFEIQITSPRLDGPYIHVIEDDGMLRVEMYSIHGEHIADDTIPADKLAEWIDSHKDY